MALPGPGGGGGAPGPAGMGGGGTLATDGRSGRRRRGTTPNRGLGGNNRRVTPFCPDRPSPGRPGGNFRSHHRGLLGSNFGWFLWATITTVDKPAPYKKKETTE